MHTCHHSTSGLRRSLPWEGPSYAAADRLSLSLSLSRSRIPRRARHRDGRSNPGMFPGGGGSHPPGCPGRKKEECVLPWEKEEKEHAASTKELWERGQEHPGHLKDAYEVRWSVPPHVLTAWGNEMRPRPAGGGGAPGDMSLPERWSNWLAPVERLRRAGLRHVT